MLDLSHTELSVVFVGNDRMRRLNARHRGIDKTTDVLSFPLWEAPPSRAIPPASGSVPLGDIVICVPKAVAQAREYDATFHQEIARLLIHGLLHLAGYDHEISAYQRRKMQAKEKELFDALHAMA